MALLLAVLYLVYGFFVLYVIVQMVLRLALIDILLALAPIALGLWILPHTAGWGRHWLRLFMTTTFQQAIQLIALALGFGFLNEVAAIGAFEPVQDLIWKLLLSIAFVYMATRVPSMLGNQGTFDAWLHTLYFGMNLPGSMVRSARSIGLVAGGAAGGPGGMAAGAMVAGAGLSRPNMYSITWIMSDWRGVPVLTSMTVISPCFSATRSGWPPIVAHAPSTQNLFCFSPPGQYSQAPPWTPAAACCAPFSIGRYQSRSPPLSESRSSGGLGTTLVTRTNRPRTEAC